MQYPFKGTMGSGRSIFTYFGPLQACRGLDVFGQPRLDWQKIGAWIASNSLPLKSVDHSVSFLGLLTLPEALPNHTLLLRRLQ